MKIHAFNNDLLPTDSETFGQTLKWYPIDTKENYNPINNAYGPDDITYQLNDNGFRSDSFDLQSEKRILFLGCSITFGIGLPVEHSWAHILLNFIRQETGYNIPYWNLSFPGCGLDTLVRLYYHHGVKLNPQLVFGYFPSYRRELYVDNDNYISFFLPRSKDNNFKNIPYLVDERIILYETEKNMCFLDCMLKSTNSKMIWNEWDKTYYDTCDNIQLKHSHFVLPDLKARDKIHPGHRSNITFAKNVWEEYKTIILDTLKD